MEIYLDHAATTPVHPEVRAAMEPWLWEHFGNPSSRHQLGQRTKAAIEHARALVAGACGGSGSAVEPHDVIFTSGATEANNLAIRSHAFSQRSRRRGAHVAVSPFEHPSAMEAALALREEGFEVTVASVDDATGAVRWCEALRQDTVLVVQMLVNNVTGALFPVPALADLCRTAAPHALLHVDCVQALGKVPLDLQVLGAHSIVLSAHKVHGPKGCGALVLGCAADGDVRNSLQPLMHGGGHEGGLRSGTENVAAIVGMGRAVARASERLTAHSKALRGAYLALQRGLSTHCPSVTLLPLREPMSLLFDNDGSHSADGADAAAVAAAAAVERSCTALAESYSRSIATLLVPGVPAEGYMNFLQRPSGAGAGTAPAVDTFGMGSFGSIGAAAARPAVYVGIGSACQARESKLSPALTALGLSAEASRRALRISLSWDTTVEEVAAACAAIGAAVEMLAPDRLVGATCAAAPADKVSVAAAAEAFAALRMAQPATLGGGRVSGGGHNGAGDSTSSGVGSGCCSGGGIAAKQEHAIQDPDTSAPLELKQSDDEGGEEPSPVTEARELDAPAAGSPEELAKKQGGAASEVTAPPAVVLETPRPPPVLPAPSAAQTKVVQHTNTLRSKACAFFNLPRGCLKGDRCLFSHEGLDGKAHAVAQAKAYEQKHGRPMPGLLGAGGGDGGAEGSCASGHCKFAPPPRAPDAPMLRSTRTIAPYRHDDGGRSCMSAPAHEPLCAATAQCLLVREDELTLKCQDKSQARGKKSNYASFQRTLVGNLCVAARSVGVNVAVERQVGRIYLHPKEGTTCGAFEALTQRCRDVFGVQNVSPVWTLPKGPEAIDTAACFALANRVLDAALAAWPAGQPLPSIKVKAQIAQQRFRALTGWGPTRFALEVAEHIDIDGRGLTVNLTRPELTLQIEVRGEGTFCSAQQLPALRGLPVGSSGRAISLLSGGIDSPVASYMMMSRGISIT